MEKCWAYCGPLILNWPEGVREMEDQENPKHIFKTTISEHVMAVFVNMGLPVNRALVLVNLLVNHHIPMGVTMHSCQHMLNLNGTCSTIHLVVHFLKIDHIVLYCNFFYIFLHVPINVLDLSIFFVQISYSFLYFSIPSRSILTHPMLMAMNRPPR